MSGSAIEIADAGGFAVGRCGECGREVLSYPDWDAAAGVEVRRCLHCDERLAGLRWVDAADLEPLGYSVDDAAAESGCASCATGGCRSKS